MPWLCTPIIYVLLVLHSTVCPASSTQNTGVLCRIEQQLVTVNSHTHTHVYTLCTSAQYLPPNMFFISLPKLFILGLPCTSIIILQTFLKASSLHFRRRHSCKIWFCCVPSGFVLMVFTSPSAIMFSCLSSCTMALASTASLNWIRKWVRTCCAAQRGKSHTAQDGNISCSYIVELLYPL